MEFKPLALPGLFYVRSAAARDSRGGFWRAFCETEFRARGLETGFVQDSISINRTRGTLRGMHFQKAPYGETKLVQCLHGSIFDVAVDLRPGSASFGRWQGLTLSGDEPGALYVPAGFAHGFLTLSDDATVYYKITPDYVQGQESGLRWNDETVGIDWPAVPSCISDRDARLPGLKELAASLTQE